MHTHTLLNTLAHLHSRPAIGKRKCKLFNCFTAFSEKKGKEKRERKQALARVAVPPAAVPLLRCTQQLHPGGDANDDGHYDGRSKDRAKEGASGACQSATESPPETGINCWHAVIDDRKASRPPSADCTLISLFRCASSPPPKHHHHHHHHSGC